MALLTDVRVVDATYGLAGAMATQLLADSGADIVRIDRPDCIRSAGDLVRLRGCRSIVLDLSRDEGRGLAARLVQQADVLITEPDLDGHEPMRSSYADLAALNSRLIWCRLTGYGDDGPMTGEPVHDHLIAARYGLYDQPGYRHGPTFVTGNMPSLGAGLLALQAIGTALYQREKTGEGQEVMVSLLAGALSFLPTIVSASIDLPGGAPAAPARGPLGALPLYSLYECADGRYVQLACLSLPFQQSAINVLGLQSEMDALGFNTPAASENAARMIEVIAGRIKQRSLAEWLPLFEAADIPHAPALSTDELLDHPIASQPDMKLTLDDPRVGSMVQMGSTLRVEGQEWRQPGPAPVPGQHSDQICRNLGLSAPEIAALRHMGVLA